MNSLGDDALPDLLVNDNSNGPRVNVEDSSGSAVVVLVWHTFMDGSINYNIDYISNFVAS